MNTAGMLMKHNIYFIRNMFLMKMNTFHLSYFTISYITDRLLICIT